MQNFIELSAVVNELSLIRVTVNEKNSDENNTVRATAVPLFDALIRGDAPHPAARNSLTRN